jgi:membrane-bound inhibitor of C-type lysozyme
MSCIIQVWLPAVKVDSFVLKNAQSGSGADPNNGSWIFSWQRSGQPVKLTTLLHLVWKLRVGGAA